MTRRRRCSRRRLRSLQRFLAAILWSSPARTRALGWSLMRSSLALKIRLVGLDHLSVANSYDHIGVVYNLQGKYVEALEYYQKSLEIKIREVGHDHLSVAMSYIWYRKCLLCTGQVHGGARVLSERSRDHNQGGRARPFVCGRVVHQHWERLFGAEQVRTGARELPERSQDHYPGGWARPFDYGIDVHEYWTCLQ
mmetsp:Transcript_94429/g.137871  ORF Transcript_94429/g.137871 Transcript_94429/m.137871 type:complete len:195 (+) Transcript_94429:490-1074(+)